MSIQDCCPQSGRVPSNLRIDHGPVSLLGRFFLAADTAAQGRGISIYFGSLQDLLDINSANSDSWRPLVPIFQPDLGGATAENTFVMVGKDKDGEVVATQAGRYYDWTDTTLREEAISLRMFYADPAAALARGDGCTIATPVGSTISGRVVFSGAGWYRRDFRGRGLARILPRISRAYAHARWNTDFTISMMADAVIAGGMADRTGYTRIERSSVELVVSPLGSMRCGLVWMPVQEMLADLEVAMGVSWSEESDPRAAAV
ncbi:conserved hypothetical protein [Bradyrhizobium oligotrophicum S58]|uniref:N-acetyltransferase domain-containing protein n=1 Tax=Bradyrhizobium oligotrophicum S58 TaxID=1245469 RepID=M4Z1E2_9BRAD|nr:hypothetical protein [Bradyrhizobium oligotrophicum]BAM86948.1 conserved hypothetical protein [Bradyrhizobium oligotrophicum S58]